MIQRYMQIDIGEKRKIPVQVFFQSYKSMMDFVHTSGIDLRGNCV